MATFIKTSFSFVYRWFSRIMVFAWYAIMLVIGGWLYSENMEPVTLKFFGVWELSASLGALVCGTLAIGGFLGFFSCLLTTKASLYFQKRRVRKANREIEKLKTLIPQE